MNKYHFLLFISAYHVTDCSNSVTSLSIDQFSTAPSCCYAEENSQTTAFRRQNTQNVAWMKNSACQTPRSIYPSIFNSFAVIRTASAKNRRFHVPQPTFLFPLETPLRLSRIMLHGWKGNSMLAKPLAAFTFNSFRVIRCLNQCVSPKIAIFTTFLLPLGMPLGQSR